jgi:hypothetical protein
MSGEYPTSAAMALWLSCQLPGQGTVPSHLFKKNPSQQKEIETILVYNTYKGEQHSIMMISEK